MSFTASQTVTSSAWTAVFTGAGSVQIQLAKSKPVRINVGTSSPALDAPGFALLQGELEEYANSNVEAGDTVYVRAVDDDSEVTVIGTGAGT